MAEDDEPRFSKADMDDELALELPDADLGDLSNDFHPAIQRKLFVNISDADYELISAPLRLVSRFLMEPTLIFYWYALIFGRRDKLSTELEQKYGQPIYSFHCAPPSNPRGGMSTHDIRATLEALMSLEESVEFHFTTISSDLTWGFSQPISYDLQPLLKYEGAPPQGDGVSVALNSKILAILRRNDISISQRLRVQYFLALGILHEFAHVVHIATTSAPKDKNGYEISPNLEPFYEDDRQAECGYACSQALINGTVEAINDRLDCEHGLWIAKWPAVWSRHESGVEGMLVPERRKPRKFCTSMVISMEHIQPLFTDQFWEHDVKRYGARELRITGKKKRLGYRFPAGVDYDSNHDGIPSDDSSNESWRIPANGIEGRIKRA
ncbi:MAG: hypothetical protein M1812_003988 [Candelaria pacifica]|nr:MAG: hypothetical protein M1812_003988 [Candelaria pacifica]